MNQVPTMCLNEKGKKGRHSLDINLLLLPLMCGEENTPNKMLPRYLRSVFGLPIMYIFHPDVYKCRPFDIDCSVMFAQVMMNFINCCMGHA